MLTRSTILTAAALTVGVVVSACSVDAAPAFAPAAGAAYGIGVTAGPCAPDVTAPEITGVSATPNTIWPPNHKMWNVTVSWSATDNCGVPVCAITSVSSNEPANGIGDGNTSPDWVFLDLHTVQLRAERAGPLSSRIYTISVSCTDNATPTANFTTATTTVTVAHDQRKKSS